MKNIKIKVVFDYGNISFTVIGLVSEEDYNERKDFGLGYIEDSDMMTDVEGFNLHTVLGGKKELDAYCLINDGEVGYAEVEVLD
jgi:hypothetical protein